MNPSNIHQRLRDDNDYQRNFFEFFEDIIHHHLPNIEMEVDPKFKPRIERPPVPPTVNETTPIDVLNEWESAFVAEIKKCGEVL